jgi:hypothetical protein
VRVLQSTAGTTVNGHCRIAGASDVSAERKCRIQTQQEIEMLKHQAVSDNTEIRALADNEIDDVNGGIFGAIIVGGMVVMVGVMLLAAARRG